MRKEVIGACELYLGDCQEVLPTLGKKVDLIFTSPPYNLGNTTGGGFPREKLGHYSPEAGIRARGGQGKWKRAGAAGGLADGYGAHSDDMPHREYVAWQREVLRCCWAQLADGGAIFYNHKPRIFDGECFSPFEYNPGLPVRQVIIWGRAGGVNFSPTFYMPMHEWIVVFAKRGFRLRSKEASGLGDTWYVPQEANTPHPAPFPIALPQRAIETTAAEIVCDPFMGWGSTGVAAVKCGRRFVGIEIEQKWFDLACTRIEAATKQPDMFIEPPKPVEQLGFAELGT